MDIIGRHKGMMEEVENLLKEKSSLEAIVAELTVDLDDAQKKLQSANSALETEKNDKLSKWKDKNDAMRMLANALSEKLEMKKEAEKLRVRPAGMPFSLTQLEEATNGFDPGHKIGQGAAGTVYKGRIGQTAVAIKKFNDVRVMQCGHSLQQEVKSVSDWFQSTANLFPSPSAGRTSSQGYIQAASDTEKQREGERNERLWRPTRSPFTKGLAMGGLIQRPESLNLNFRHKSI